VGRWERKWGESRIRKVGWIRTKICVLPVTDADRKVVTKAGWGGWKLLFSVGEGEKDKGDTIGDKRLAIEGIVILQRSPSLPNRPKLHHFL
jgi:hypothetical protein